MFGAESRARCSLLWGNEASVWCKILVLGVYTSRRNVCTLRRTFCAPRVGFTLSFLLSFASVETEMENHFQKSVFLDKRRQIKSFKISTELSCSEWSLMRTFSKWAHGKKTTKQNTVNQTEGKRFKVALDGVTSFHIGTRPVCLSW